jgi:hypothetical protein
MFICIEYLSRYALCIRKLKRESHSAAEQLAQQMANASDMSSDDYDSEIESDPEMDAAGLDTYKRRKVDRPMSSFRFVRRLARNLPLSKMHTDESLRSKFIKNLLKDTDDDPQNYIADVDIDDDDDSDVVVENPSLVAVPSKQPEHNLDDIREKTVEHDRQLIKGIQLANANTNNPKIINGYSVTSSTCTLQ